MLSLKNAPRTVMRALLIADCSKMQRRGHMMQMGTERSGHSSQLESTGEVCTRTWSRWAGGRRVGAFLPEDVCPLLQGLLGPGSLEDVLGGSWTQQRQVSHQASPQGRGARTGGCDFCPTQVTPPLPLSPV